MVERIPPHSLDAEKSVLGALMLSKEAMSDVLNILHEDDFYSAQNKAIYQVIIDLYRHNQPIDIVVVCDELKKNNSLEKVGGRAYISALCSDVPSTFHAADYAKIVSEKAALRRLIGTAEEIKAMSYEETTDTASILDYAEKNIYEIAQDKQSKDYRHISEVLDINVKMINEAIESNGKVVGLSTGFIDLDKVTAGLHKSDLIIVAARPAMGKTAFALNIGLNVATKSNGTVLMFSLEMASEQLSQRLLSMQSLLSMQKIKEGAISTSEDWEKLSMGLDALSNSNIVIDDTPDISILEMKNKCRRLKNERGLDLIIVDYLQLMKSDSRNDNRQQEISELSRYLKLLAREIDCPVIVLSQLSRAPEMRGDHRPILSDLRESGSIEQDADIVMFLYRDDYYNEGSETPGICEVNIAKHRSGPTKKIDLVWMSEYTKFNNYMPDNRDFG